MKKMLNEHMILYIDIAIGNIRDGIDVIGICTLTNTDFFFVGNLSTLPLHSNRLKLHGLGSTKRVTPIVLFAAVKVAPV